jgi:squalene synthase HpnC
VSDGLRLAEEPAESLSAAVDAVNPGAARADGENFPVALRLLPTSRRHYLMAVYGFARTTDDIGDQAPADQRLSLLDELEADLRRLYARLGEPGPAEQEPAEQEPAEQEPAERKPAGPGPAEPGLTEASADQGAPAAPGVAAEDKGGDLPVSDRDTPRNTDFESSVSRDGGGGGGPAGGDGAEPRIAVVRALRAAVADCGIPMQPFLDLIQANRQDQVVSRYQTFEDLRGYCRLSADPVGRIVLYIFGSFSPRRAELSDSVCTALQLAEHWQDVAEDLRAGRIYLPLEDLEAFGCTPGDLARESASRPVRALLEFEAGRARVMLDAGAPLIGMLRGAARAAVAGYVAGGRAALAAIAAADHDVLAGTPSPRKPRLAAEMLLAYARGR